MSVNVTVQTFETAAIVTLQDGSVTRVEPQDEYFVQMIDGGLCAISEVADADDHAPPLPPGFLSQMLKLWQLYGPKATPV